MDKMTNMVNMVILLCHNQSIQCDSISILKIYMAIQLCLFSGHNSFELWNHFSNDIEQEI